jgi:hypothetical protein
MSDLRTGAHQAQTQGLRRDVARWLREAADETRKWTACSGPHTTSRTSRSSSATHAIPRNRSFVPQPLDKVLSCLEVLGNGASYSNELSDPIRAAIKGVLADAEPEDHSAGRRRE